VNLCLGQFDEETGLQDSHGDFASGKNIIKKNKNLYFEQFIAASNSKNFSYEVEAKPPHILFKEKKFIK
jgi:hypothetical protein